MKIHRTNHTRPADKSTHRVKVAHETARNFEATLAKNGTLLIQVRDRDYDWEIEITKSEITVIKELLTSY
jgi:hypothetical protein